MYFSPAVVAAFAATVYGANVPVQVAQNNQLSFTPQLIQANAGDTIQFQFQNGNHTATAGTMNAGCAPGGQFYSGFAAVNNNPTQPATQTGVPVANGFAVKNGNTGNQGNAGQGNANANTGKAGKGNNKFKIRGAEWFAHVERDVELDERDPVVFVEARDGGVMEIRASGGATFSVPVTQAMATTATPVYCSQQLHCIQGPMVAMINGNQQQLQAYTQLAKQAQVNVVPSGGPSGGTASGYTPNQQATTTTNNNGNANNGNANANAQQQQQQQQAQQAQQQAQQAQQQAQQAKGNN